MKAQALFAAAAIGCVLAGSATARAPGQASAQRAGNPADNLPANIAQLTWFGERASWSPDGKRIAFMAKSFGDAFEVEVATRRITLLTHFPNPGYLRVQYLPNGDYLLVGARQFQDVSKTRYTDQELWYLRKDLRSRPIPLEQKLTEGIAISRKSTKIAWAMDPRTHPGQVPERTAIIYTGDIVEQDGRPVLTNKREAIRLNAPDCVGTEPQDFRNDDKELVFVCYEYNMARKAMNAKVRGVDLATGKVTVYLQDTNEYNEVEGIYPDGRHALVESSRDQMTATSRTIDIWKLRLDGGGKDMRRMTRWGAYEGFKASNPVVSPDGRAIAFQSAKSSDEAGVGYGIFLLKER